MPSAMLAYRTSSPCWHVNHPVSTADSRHPADGSTRLAFSAGINHSGLGTSHRRPERFGRHAHCPDCLSHKRLTDPPGSHWHSVQSWNFSHKRVRCWISARVSSSFSVANHKARGCHVIDHHSLESLEVTELQPKECYTVAKASAWKNGATGAKSNISCWRSSALECYGY